MINTFSIEDFEKANKILKQNLVKRPYFLTDNVYDGLKEQGVNLDGIVRLETTKMIKQR